MIDILVDPTDWSGGFIVVTNVSHQLAREIVYRSEDELYSKVVDEENKERRILSIEKRNTAASLEDAKKERMHQCPRIK